MSHKVVTRAAAAADAVQISALHAQVFGPGRFARTAYRVREGSGSAAPPISPYCRVAMLGSRLIAAVKFAEVTIGGRARALLLGPLAVDPEFKGQGFGRQLVAESLESARQSGKEIVILVGDEPYYGRLGFVPVPIGQIVFPGPVHPGRILAAPLNDDALAHYRGLISIA